MSKKEDTVQAHVFQPLMDWWVAGSVGALLLMMVISIPLLLWKLTITWQALVGVALLIFFALYLIDMAFFTSYRLSENGLIIHNNFRSLIFPYRTMEKIQNGNILGLFSVAGRKRYALSSRNLRIRLNKGAWKEISISPKEQQVFLNQLLENIDRERTERSTFIRQDI